MTIGPPSACVARASPCRRGDRWVDGASESQAQFAHNSRRIEHTSGEDANATVMSRRSDFIGMAIFPCNVAKSLAEVDHPEGLIPNASRSGATDRGHPTKDKAS